MGADTGYGTQAEAMVVTGLGLGMVVQVLVLAVQNAAEPRDLGVVASGATFFRQIGGSFGVAILGAILADRLSAEVARLPGAGGNLSRDAGSIRPERLAALPAPAGVGLVHAFAEALHWVSLAAGSGPPVGNEGHDFGMTPTGLVAAREELDRLHDNEGVGPVAVDRVRRDLTAEAAALPT